MPRLVACAACAILQRIPDVPKSTPMTKAVLEWENGERYVYEADDGKPLMVPAYDPVLEDFITRHEHNFEEQRFLNGEVINVWAVDQKTWDTMDVVTKIKTELQTQTNRHYEDRDTYREAATSCYNDHGNPDITTGCRDYLDDSKRIGEGHYKVEGRTITVPPKLRQYLCYLCPYQHAYVNVELRRRKGQYDENKNLEARRRRRRAVN